MHRQVIRELVVQRSRSEFLTMAYEMEARSHRNTHHLLTAVNMLLQKHRRALQGRLVGASHVCGRLAALYLVVAVDLFSP